MPGLFMPRFHVLTLVILPTFYLKNINVVADIEALLKNSNEKYYFIL